MHHAAIPTQPHSGPGIASFIISLAASAVLLVGLGIAGALQSHHGRMDEDSTAAILLGLVLLLMALAYMVALGLGIAALVQTGRNKLYGVLGTTFSATGLACLFMLLLFGMLLEG